MKLIKELQENIEFVTEGTESAKRHYIVGIFLQSNIPNKNGRLYPKHVMEKEVNRYKEELIDKNRAYGELSHPQSASINLDRVSHIITELKPQGDDFVGKARLTETPMGNIAIGLLKSGASLGVSSRGLGSLKPTKDGIMEVQEDFRLATAADIVADPSAPNAFIQGIMENADWVYNASTNEWYKESLHSTRKQVSTMTLEEITNKKLKIFENFINNFSRSTKYK